MYYDKVCETVAEALSCVDRVTCEQACTDRSWCHFVSWKLDGNTSNNLGGA